MKHLILKQKVYHDGKSMVVLKPDMKREVPDHLLQTFIDEGVIDGPDGEVDADSFIMKHVGFGKYEISGPGLDEPELVKGKVEAETRLDALNAGAADIDAPAD